VATTDFIEHMMAIYKQFMPSSATIYEQDERRGGNWTADSHREGRRQSQSRELLLEVSFELKTAPGKYTPRRRW
jgi:hypothetical protein